MKKGPFYRKFIRPLKHAVGLAIIKIAILKIRLFPRGLTLCFMRLLGTFAYLVLKRDRKIALANLSHVFPEKTDSELEDFARNVFRRRAMDLADMVLARKIVNSDPPLWRVQGEEHMRDYLDKYGGGVVITGHIGCFELIPGICAKIGYRVGVVGRQLYDPRVDKILVKQRESLGMIVVPSDASPRRLIRLIKDGYFVGILMDTNTRSVDGRPADFFGLETRTISGPIALSIMLKRPPLPMAIYREDRNHFVLKIHPPIEHEITGDKDLDVKSGLRAANRAIEGLILDHPEEWIWFHPKFRDVEGFYTFL